MGCLSKSLREYDKDMVNAFSDIEVDESVVPVVWGLLTSVEGRKCPIVALTRSKIETFPIGIKISYGMVVWSTAESTTTCILDQLIAKFDPMMKVGKCSCELLIMEPILGVPNSYRVELKLHAIGS